MKFIASDRLSYAVLTNTTPFPPAVPGESCVFAFCFENDAFPSEIK